MPELCIAAVCLRASQQNSGRHEVGGAWRGDVEGQGLVPQRQLSPCCQVDGGPLRRVKRVVPDRLVAFSFAISPPRGVRGHQVMRTRVVANFL
jgi:hypothetical protein